MLCNQCQAREATIHTAHFTSNSGDAPKHVNLCSVCFASSNPTMAHALEDAVQAGCYFCGRPPDEGSAGPIPLARPGGVSRMSFMCRSCNAEYHRVSRMKMPGIGTGSFTPEQMQSFDPVALGIELEAHMRAWVADRDRRDPDA